VVAIPLSTIQEQGPDLRRCEWVLCQAAAAANPPQTIENTTQKSCAKFADYFRKISTLVLVGSRMVLQFRCFGRTKNTQKKIPALHLVQMQLNSFVFNESSSKKCANFALFVDS
jgi:hypothetical protein